MSQINVEVQACHIDAFGHVNNARFLEFFEAGKWDFFGKSGKRQALLDAGYALVVTNAQVSYVRPVKLGDTLTITTSLECITQREVQLRIEARNAAGKMCVTSLMTHCFLDKSGRPIELNDDMIAAMTFECGDHAQDRAIANLF